MAGWALVLDELKLHLINCNKKLKRTPSRGGGKVSLPQSEAEIIIIMERERERDDDNDNNDDYNDVAGGCCCMQQRLANFALLGAS